MEKVMANSPSVAIGGNQVEMTQKGKMRITTPTGKIKTLSQDQFRKQLIKNADKIQNGDSFEFKKDNTNVIAGSLAATVAVVGLGIAGYKGKLGKKIQNFMTGLEKKVRKLLDKSEMTIEEKRNATYSVNDAKIDAHKNFLKEQGLDNPKEFNAKRKAIRKAREADLNAIEGDINKPLSRASFNADGSLKEKAN